jgi:hypothetical protein
LSLGWLVKIIARIEQDSSRKKGSGFQAIRYIYIRFQHRGNILRKIMVNEIQGFPIAAEGWLPGKG